MDLSDIIRASVVKARLRGYIARLDEALDLILDADASIVRGVLLDLRADMAKGQSWMPGSSAVRRSPKAYDESEKDGGNADAL